MPPHTYTSAELTIPPAIKPESQPNAICHVRFPEGHAGNRPRLSGGTLAPDSERVISTRSLINTGSEKGVPGNRGWRS